MEGGQRCGFQTELEKSKQRESEVCSRDVWKDKDRCIWHYRNDKNKSKSVEALQTALLEERQSTDNGEKIRLHGAILPEIDARNELSFGNCILIGANLTGARLSGISFQGTDLREADLTQADCSHTIFSDANLTDTTVTRTNFFKSDISRAEFKRVTFRKTILAKADLTRSNLTGAKCRGNNYPYAVFSDAVFTDSTLTDVKFRSVDLSGCDFTSCDLQETKFIDCDVSSTKFTSADLTGVTFSDRVCRGPINLSRRYSLEADLTDVIFSQANLQYVMFHEIDLRNAKFNRTDLTGTRFWESDLRGANFSRAASEKPGVEFWKTDLSDAIFSNSELSHATFIRAPEPEGSVENQAATNGGENPPNLDLTHTDFSNANMVDAVFSNADFKQADFSKADFSDSELLFSDFEGEDMSDLTLQDASLAQSNLENTVLIQTDLRGANLNRARLYQTVFLDTLINSETEFDRKCVYENTENYHFSHRKAEWVYRRLEELYRGNAMPHEARNYHVMKSEVRRKRHRDEIPLPSWIGHKRKTQALVRYFSTLEARTMKKIESHIGFIVSTASYYLTKHGESYSRLLVWIVGVATVCALLYPFTGGIEVEGERYAITSSSDVKPAYIFEVFKHSSTHSLRTLALGEFGEFHSSEAQGFARLLAGLQSVVGPLLFSLFFFIFVRRLAE